MRTKTELTLPTETLDIAPMLFYRPMGVANKDEVVVLDRKAAAAEAAKRILDADPRATAAKLTDRQLDDALAALHDAQGDVSTGNQQSVRPEGVLRFRAMLKLHRQDIPSAVRSIPKLEANHRDPFTHASEVLFRNAYTHLLPEGAEALTDMRTPQPFVDYLEAVRKGIRRELPKEATYRRSPEGRFAKAQRDFEGFEFQNLPPGSKEVMAALVAAAVDVAVDRAIRDHMENHNNEQEN